MKVRVSLLLVLAAVLVAPFGLTQSTVDAQAPSAAPAVGPAAAQAPAAPATGRAQAAATQTRPIRVYLRAGLKTHAEGQHDYPQFLADWSKMLTDRGAIVDGSLHFPTADELAGVDVIVMYKGDAGYMTAREKAVLEDYLKRGGGLVGFHDAICADDPAWWSTIFGGAKKHGQTNFTLEAPVSYTFADPGHPITAGAKGFTITDEAFFLMTWAETGLTVVANAPMAPTASAQGHHGEVVPQMWTYERTMFGGQPFRSFVWMQGHNYTNLQHPDVLPVLLRGVAWAAKAPLDSLLTVRPARGGGGGGGRGGRGAGNPGRGGAAPTAPAPGAGAPAGRGAN